MNFQPKDVGVPDNITKTLLVIFAITGMNVADMRGMTPTMIDDIAI